MKFVINTVSIFRFLNWRLTWRRRKKSLINFSRVNDFIYRSAQPNAYMIAWCNTIGIKSILNLREDRSDLPLLKSTTINYFNVKLIATRFTHADVVATLKIMQNAPKPLLIHCKYGADRTGLVVAMYRIVFENWPKEKALSEITDSQYGFNSSFRNIPAYIKQVDIDSIKCMLEQ
jgi:protein tyrosine/serine phosphatase